MRRRIGPDADARSPTIRTPSGAERESAPFLVDFRAERRDSQRLDRHGAALHAQCLQGPPHSRTRRTQIGRPLQDGAGHRLAAVGHDRGRRQEAAQFLRQQLSRPRRQRRTARRRESGARPLRFGMASVRFICGTQEEHKQLEARISRFLGMEDTILYGSCFDANGGLFETLLSEEDAVISDALNHASIIDGVRLSKAKRFRYANNDMADLEARLKEAAGARFRLIATDGVFSMDGIIADLAGHLRPGRQIRRDGHGRRQPRRRVRRQERPRLARALRRRGQGGHHHRHARQGAGRRLGRLHVGKPRSRRLAAAALPALSLLQHADAGDRRRLDQGRSTWSTKAMRCAKRSTRNAARFRERHDQARLQRSPAPAIRSSR